MKRDIEIWLDDDQDQSVEALVAIIEKNLALKEVTPWKTEMDSLPLEDSSLPMIHELADHSFVLTVKKKHMHVPVGRRTKPSKKK